MNYYNENDRHAAAWLRQLIVDGLIPAGYVDERSIEDVRPDELIGYTQCHFFAGIGGWSYALALAGFPSSVPVWTGSCPCQPFSVTGKRKGTADSRHLWPAFYWLIEQCRPAIVFGEQVASPLGRAWWAGVRADLEIAGYESGAVDLCAAGVGAPHKRQRLYWMAHRGGERCETIRLPARPEWEKDLEIEWCGKAGGMANAKSNGLQAIQEQDRQQNPGSVGKGGMDNRRTIEGQRVGFTIGAGLEGYAGNGGDRNEPGRIEASAPGSTTPPSYLSVPVYVDHWADHEWVYCADEKYRRVKPGILLLADGIPNRAPLIRGYGNAIVPALAAQFIIAGVEAINESREGLHP